MEVWKPFATAPQDTSIDLWHRKYGRIASCWHDHGGRWMDAFGFIPEQEDITHWMGIPGPPPGLTPET